VLGAPLLRALPAALSTARSHLSSKSHLGPACSTSVSSCSHGSDGAAVLTDGHY
jgi:hypothetical protein